MIYRSLTESPEPVSTVIVMEEPAQDLDRRPDEDLGPEIEPPEIPPEPDPANAPEAHEELDVEPPPLVPKVDILPPAAELPAAGLAAVSETTLPEVAGGIGVVTGPFPEFGERFKKSFGARSGKMRAKMAKQYGGTPQSERAVDEGLKWLARHQRPDGSWSFDHLGPDCDETCQGTGSHRDWTAGSTAMAVLCFLGAGHTHKEGDYKDQVRAGLRYILSQRGGKRVGGDYTKGGRHPGMYIQGFVGIALAEAYAMTRDNFLESPAREALNFIAEAQDPEGGGWRYRPREKGDTSVVGWQVMALTSGRVAGLGDWRPQRGRTMKFLDSVQSNGGANYGYTSYGAKPSTTAIGLLCRMYLGWSNRVALQNGVLYLAQKGPDDNDMYYNYYATQVLHHWGGRRWDAWNERMRSRLVATQTQTGHGAGSWDAKYCRWGSNGGRLYVTCLSILTLEVYYRHLPLYQQ